MFNKTYFVPAAVLVVLLAGCGQVKLLEPQGEGPETQSGAETEPTVEAWRSYYSDTGKFEVQLPPESRVSQDDSNGVRIDMSVTPGTNLHEKYLTITSTEATPETCAAADQGAVKTREMVTLGGNEFLKETGSDAGAGNYYDTITYSAMFGGKCYSLNFVLHSVNPGNYDVPPPVFDMAQETAVFDQVVATFGVV
jgi:hypothetical protein